MVKSKMQILTSFFPLKNQIRSAFSIKNAIFEGSGTINSVIIAQKSCFFLKKIVQFLHFVIKICILHWFKKTGFVMADVSVAEHVQNKLTRQ